jgi:hypothetical protein
MQRVAHAVAEEVEGQTVTIMARPDECGAYADQ